MRTQVFSLRTQTRDLNHDPALDSWLHVAQAVPWRSPGLLLSHKLLQFHGCPPEFPVGFLGPHGRPPKLSFWFLGPYYIPP